MIAPFYFFILVLGILVGISVYFQKDVQGYLKFFSPFLIITLIVSFIGYSMGMKDINNLALYNFFSVFEFVFYLFVLRQIIINQRIKKIILCCGVLYPIIAITDICFVTGIHAYHTVTYGFGAILIVIFCLYHFYELFRTPRFGRLIQQPAFWICSGLLLFYAGTLPYFIAINILTPFANPHYDAILGMLNIINIVSNCLYYSTFVIAFLCKVKNL